MAKKGKKARLVLANPLASQQEPNGSQLADLEGLIKDRLSNLFPVTQVSSTEVISELDDASKANLFKLPRSERSKKLKELKQAKRSELNSANTNLLPKEYQTGVILGLKRTLKGLENKSLKGLVYDCDANIETLKCLFDKGSIPMVPLSGLSAIIREIVGFPALCMGFPSENKDEKIAAHFQPIIDSLYHVGKYPLSLKKEDETQEKKLEPEPVPATVPIKPAAKTQPITLLKRESKFERAFHPLAAVDMKKGQENEDPFKGDFISFSGAKRNLPKDSSRVYKRTKMELQK